MAKVLIQRELKRYRVDVHAIEQQTYRIYNYDPNDFLVNEMLELLDQYHRIRLMMDQVDYKLETMPGIGIVTAASFVAEIGPAFKQPGGTQYLLPNDINYLLGQRIFRGGEMMKKDELKTRLHLARIPETWYSLEEVGNRDQKICLDEQPEKWLVYYSERGAKFRLKEHFSEDCACKDIYKRLIDWFASNQQRKDQ